MPRRIFWLTITILLILASVGQFAQAQDLRWDAQYFDNHEFTANDKATLRGEGALNFNWGTGTPGGMKDGFPSDGFAVRFLSEANFEAGNYRFEFRADDALLFYVDDAVRLDSRGAGNPGATVTLDTALSAGNHKFKVEYFEFSKDAYINLNWYRLDGAAPPAAGAPAAEPTPFIYYAPKVDSQPARADGSIVHEVRAGDTTNAIAVAYGVDPKVIVERNSLSGGGRWIYPGQELVIRDATALGGGTSTTLAPVDTEDDDTSQEITTTEPEETDSQPTAILTDSDEELRSVQIDNSCLTALRGEHDSEYSAEDVVALNRFEVAELGIRGVTPHEWEGEPLGIVARGNLLQDPSAIIHHVEPELNFNEFVREVLPQYGFATDLPPAVCIQQLSTTDFWLFYIFPETQMPFIGVVTQVLALLERDGMTMIALLARPEDFVALLETAFLPAVWNYDYGDAGLEG